MDRFELRRQDLSLDEDQLAVQNAFGDFFAKESPTTVVRAAEPLGFDPELWTRLIGMGVASMGLPEAAGGDDATLVDLVLVAEEHGRAVAPVPLISHVVATRLLARAGASADVVAPAAAGERIATLALQPVVGAARQLVPDAAVAADVLAWSTEGLVLYPADQPPAPVPNQGSTPLAWWQPTGNGVPLATGAEAEQLFRAAVREWKLLTAAALVGMTEAALQLAVEFAKTRRTLGVPIGSLQGVAFPLADVVTAISGARNLVYKAAWFAEHEPAERPELPLVAFSYAVRTATEGTQISAHMQGGLGFTSEADASLYFLRAKGWSLLGGDPADDLKEIGAALARTA